MEKNLRQEESSDEILSRLIRESTDEHLRKGTAFQRGSFLNNVDFSDIADLVLYYISLQEDLSEISRIETREFWKIFKEEWDKWQKESGDVWDRYKKGEKMSKLHQAWWCGPGPLGGTAGPAEIYSSYSPGILLCSFLYQYFLPGDLPCSKTMISWDANKNMIENKVFPKWRRQSLVRIGLVIKLAEQICEEMRKIKNITTMGR